MPRRSSSEEAQARILDSTSSAARIITGREAAQARILDWTSSEEARILEHRQSAVLTRACRAGTFPLGQGDFAMEEGEIGEEVYFLSRGTVAIIAGERQVATLSGGMPCRLAAPSNH